MRKSSRFLAVAVRFSLAFFVTLLLIGNMMLPRSAFAAKKGPLLPTYWNQHGLGGPDTPNSYNKFCPVLFGHSTPAGCTAVAMAQILAYHGKKYGAPTIGIGSHEDTIAYGGGLQGTPGYSLYEDFSSHQYNWPAMPLSFSSDNIAQLILDCGVAIDTDYSATGSGANATPPLNIGSANVNVYSYALQTYFGYASGGTLIKRISYVSDVAWFNRLKTEIDAGRPVLYLMYSRDGKDKYGNPVTEGHALVMDGYDNSLEFTL